MSFEGRRRLQAMPSWGDFVVVMGLCFVLYLLLKILQFFSDRWRNMMKKRIKDALEERKLMKDNFRLINGYSWDYCIVFKVHVEGKKLTKAQEQNSLKTIVDRLAESGLQTKLFYSAQNDEVYCKIRAPIKRLMDEADRIDYKLVLDPNYVSMKLAEGNMKGPPEKQWAPVQIPNNTLETTLDPYEYIYMSYEKDDASKQCLFKVHENGTIFRGVDRLKLIKGIIAARRYDGGCHLDMLRLIKNGCIEAFFPLHDVVELRTVEEKWLRFCQPPWLQHVDVVRDYFGEKIGLYFAFIGHYTTWLITPAVVGFFAWINVAAQNNDPNAPIMPYFAAFIAVWSTMFLENWKRKESTLAMKWGTVDFEEEESDRPEYQGVPVPSPVNGEEILYFPARDYSLRLAQSAIIISCLIMVVLGVVASIFVMRITLSKSSNSDVASSASVVASIVNAIQIQVLNMLYGSVAIALNDYENHRTDTEYEDALISKTFIFQFINSFSSLFYIAFVKPFIPQDDPCKFSCMVELQTALGTIFLTRMTSGSLLQVLTPYINKKLKEKAESKGTDLSKLTHVENQFMQPEYHIILGTFQDFADLAMQFGYTTMFIVAYPLATVMSFVNNYVEMRVDAWKLCQLLRRPEPRSCEDIGTWMTIFEIVCFAAVLINSALIAFTGSFAFNYTWYERAWIFVGTSAGLILVKFITSIVIPDTSRETEIQIARSKFIVSKLGDSVPDDMEPDLSKVSAENNYVIRIIDDDPL